MYRTKNLDEKSSNHQNGKKCNGTYRNLLQLMDGDEESTYQKGLAFKLWQEEKKGKEGTASTVRATSAIGEATSSEPTCAPSYFKTASDKTVTYRPDLCQKFEDEEQSSPKKQLATVSSAAIRPSSHLLQEHQNESVEQKSSAAPNPTEDQVVMVTNEVTAEFAEDSVPNPTGNKREIDATCQTDDQQDRRSQKRQRREHEIMIKRCLDPGRRPPSIALRVAEKEFEQDSEYEEWTEDDQRVVDEAQQPLAEVDRIPFHEIAGRQLHHLPIERTFQHCINMLWYGNRTALQRLQEVKPKLRDEVITANKLRKQSKAFIGVMRDGIYTSGETRRLAIDDHNDRKDNYRGLRHSYLSCVALEEFVATGKCSFPRSHLDMTPPTVRRRT